MRFVLPGMVFVLWLCPADKVVSCSCLNDSPCGSYARASAVFLGEVIGASIQGDMLVARMHVTRAWKGIVDDVVMVSNEAHSSCSFEFAVGERYVVYARGDDRQFRTNVCAGGGLLPAGSAEPELPPIGGRVSGEVIRFNETFTSREDIHTPMVGIRVSIENDAGTIESHTDENGRFALNGVPPGEHRVRADLGPGVDGSAMVTLEGANDCRFVLIAAEPSGRVSRTLIDGDGDPLADIKLSAVPLDHDWSKDDLTGVRETTTGQDGAFEFGSMTSGQYVVGVNLFDPPRVKQPFPATYYPDATSRNDAAIVTVADGDVELEPLVLHQTMPQTVIFADVICRDGSIPRSVLVNARPIEPSSYYEEASYKIVDGKVRLEVMRDVIYDVYGQVLVPFVDASGRESGVTSLRTPSVRIDSASPPPVIHFVAPRERCHLTTIDGSKP